ncbi:5-bromo-4-chloroindolyl phosphate hydrolysis family protein [Sulfitobacter mediterraneus]|uniref:5-bromo-4-chloroindolyl phosphate hydrolysis family protein n=1 Tax=Sulfitobacter mediterraneus TaxID=83219 RepID=UPI0019333502|nr:5-bromo-4-chloroindolyl phosphate hydrolysis family protein [Sulfitobacter mediterraneus]MBM1634022.1 5-bromo-4-chloroindolyl phosphate hydrolysis family protein [Sulfitobacter mediterraneus]MBM1641462.1 5-bromo-4-chloroindolyl phosphate hydrolysis family protein [Sulfitobacter mediterraneus]MBM1645887.1 5-bromo-4-chloroindolyl phosphate hydrolysis family protein [Sulfitobacter mediterraneus]MBM1649582.1 5-bromo-4-chloroindolyl phosphate hydrolysis family protein [Sulfitobacter mediterraneus
MAKRFGGKYSPDGQVAPDSTPRKRIEVDPAGGRSNVLFAPAIVLVFTSLNDGATSLALGLAGAASLILGAWLLREGLRAEAEFNSRKVARKPAIPRKLLAAAAAGLGAALAVLAHQDGSLAILAPLLFGGCTAALHLTAFGLDPMKSKGMEGIDTFQQDRVARVVDEAEKLLAGMSDAMARAGDRAAAKRLEVFQDTARELIRTVEEDPRDLTAARKYLSVYLRGARDATAKFADIYSRSQDDQARADYLALLDDLDRNFAARTRKSLLEDRSDLTVEIDVLRERLSREGVRLD